MTMAETPNDPDWMKDHEPTPRDTLDGNLSQYQVDRPTTLPTENHKTALVGALLVWVVAMLYFLSAAMWIPLAIIGGIGVILAVVGFMTRKSNPS